MSRQMTWTAARTLDDLGECVALWLERRLPHMPTSYYCDDVGRETTHLVPTLTRLNRSGKFITECSQPACTPNKRAYGGERPWQRAAIMGYVPSRWLPAVRRQLSGLSGVELHITPPGAPHQDATMVSCLTQTRTPIRLFGYVWSPAEVAEHFGGIPGWDDHPGLHRTVIGDLLGCYQVSVVDTVWGRNDVLWAALQRLV